MRRLLSLAHMRTCMLVLLLAGTTACAPKIVQVPVSRLIPCPENPPEQACKLQPAVDTEGITGLARGAIALRLWGSDCRSEVMAWRDGYAPCDKDAE